MASAHEPRAVRMYVVRHAEHVTGALAHLSRKGSLQASSIANTLKRQRQVDAVYTSPRSVETAQSICKELHVRMEVDKRLLPWNGGRLNGWSKKQVQEAMPEVYRKRFVERNPDFKVPEGESLNDRLLRVKEFLADIVARHGGEQVVVVTHGGIIDDMFRNAHSLPPTQLTGIKKPYGSLSVLVFSEGRFREEQWGGVDHLPQVVAESPTGGQLYLFPHQVAGSFPMLRSDLGELCKPATLGEMETYESFLRERPTVARFAPAFSGKVVIDVKHILQNDEALCGPLQVMHSPDQSNGEDEDEDLEVDADAAVVVVGGPAAGQGPGSMEDAMDEGEGGLVAAMQPPQHARQQHQQPSEGLPRGRAPFLSKRRRTASHFADKTLLDVKRFRAQTGEEVESAMTDTASVGSGGEHGLGELQRFGSDSMQIEREGHQGGAMHSKPAIPGSCDAGAGGARAWSVNTLWDRFIEHRNKKAVEVAEGKFVYLVMENLTHGLSHPHILDLKMGTQQHGSHESAAKKAAKQRRVESTTSKTIGARIGGMQIYDEKEHVYVLKDKYWGRTLDEQGLCNALFLFVTEQLTNRVRGQVVKDIIAQLDALERAVRACTWRFYGCSILIVFDGALGNVRRDRFPSNVSDKSEASMASHPEATLSSSLPETALLTRRFLEQQRLRCGQLQRSRSHSFDQPGSASEGGSGDPQFCVQVRLIDFAKCERDHTTGFDEGLVFGICNLRKLFFKILLDAPSTPAISRSGSAHSLVLR